MIRADLFRGPPGLDEDVRFRDSVNACCPERTDLVGERVVETCVRRLDGYENC